jgi:hypothetical protein
MESRRTTIGRIVISEVGDIHLASMPDPDWSLPKSFSDPTYFALSGYVFLGTAGEEGSDRFDFYVCSPRWLADHFQHVAEKYVTEPAPGGQGRPRPDSEPVAFFSQGMVLMSEWSEERFRALLNDICVRFVGPDWPTVASRLNRYLLWEYDYKYDEYVDAHPEQFRLPEGWTSRSYE